MQKINQIYFPSAINSENIYKVLKMQRMFRVTAFLSLPRSTIYELPWDVSMCTFNSIRLAAA